MINLLIQLQQTTAHFRDPGCTETGHGAACKIEFGFAVDADHTTIDTDLASAVGCNASVALDRYAHSLQVQLGFGFDIDVDTVDTDRV